MKKVNLGNTSVEVSCMSLGCMNFGSVINKETSFKLLDTYFAAGGSFLDTANSYSWWIEGSQGGESERLIGEWMQQNKNRAQLFLATKVGANTNNKDAAEQDFVNNVEGLSKSAILSAVEQSLKNLQTDYIDLLYIHVDFRITPLKETLNALNQLVVQKKVRHIGCSNMSAWRIEEARNISLQNNWAEFTCVQQAYTFMHPRAGADFKPFASTDDSLLDYVHQRGLSLLAYSPLLGGYYTRADKQASYWKKHCYENAENESRLAQLNTMADHLNVCPNQLIFAWMLQKKIPAIPLIAASNVEHLQQNIGALTIRLSAEQLEVLDHC